MALDTTSRRWAYWTTEYKAVRNEMLALAERGGERDPRLFPLVERIDADYTAFLAAAKRATSYDQLSEFDWSRYSDIVANYPGAPSEPIRERMTRDSGALPGDGEDETPTRTR